MCGVALRPSLWPRMFHAIMHTRDQLNSHFFGALDLVDGAFASGRIVFHPRGNEVTTRDCALQTTRGDLGRCPLVCG